MLKKSILGHTKRGVVARILSVTNVILTSHHCTELLLKKLYTIVIFWDVQNLLDGIFYKNLFLS